MPIIITSTDRVTELETLNDELKETCKRYTSASSEGKRIVKLQIRQIERDIQRNSMNFGGGRNCGG